MLRGRGDQESTIREKMRFSEAGVSGVMAMAFSITIKSANIGSHLPCLEKAMRPPRTELTTH